MTVSMAGRAEIALRTLRPTEQGKVLRAVSLLGTYDAGQLVSSDNVRRLTGSAEGLYAFRASPQLRVLFSRRGDGYIVEDIVRPDRVKHLQADGSAQ
jgi:hypothetical protein